MFANVFLDKSIEYSPELRRIMAVPRRKWSLEVEGEQLSDALTPLLKKPGGTMRLKPVQAMALHDAGVHLGGFLPIVVGGGKTLTSLLVPYVIPCQRPLLLVPAALKTKTERERIALAEHWRIPYERIRIVSFEMLGRHQASDLLANYQPDLIVVDEAHKLKNAKAAVTRRVHRYMKAHPNTRFVAMSGTMTKRSLKDYAHLSEWCLGQNSPLPHGWNELEKWSSALDEKVNQFARVHPGALLDMAEPEDFAEDGDEVTTARRAFRRRLVETPGVVATSDGYDGASIYIDHEIIPLRNIHVGGLAATEGAFTNLRENDLDPDGWLLPDGMSKWRKARELALGFYYRPNPRPPEWWSIPRQAWSKTVREILKSNRRGLDSEYQVALAVSRGDFPEAVKAYEAWRAVEKQFDYRKEAVWLDDTVVNMAAAWLRAHPHGIVWTEHTAFGNRLETVSGFPYFREEGKDERGRTFYHPETDPNGYRGPCIASVASNATGRNLQFHWHENYIVSPKPNGLEWEQLLGRMHRDHQEADTVTVTVALSCIEHFEAMQRAQNDARYIQDSTGQAQKLLYADLTFPDQWTVMGLPSRRFQR